MEDEKLFFENNDWKVCRKLSKLLIYCLVAFPILFFMSALNIWDTSYENLAIMTVIGVTVLLFPMIGLKLKFPIHVMKYVSIISVIALLAVMGTDETIGIKITYGLGIAVSCMYFDKKFTRNISFIGAVFMLVSTYFRYKCNLSSTFAVGTGLLVEYIIMSVVLINIADASRKLLVNLHDSEKVKLVVKNCEEASHSLVDVVERLAKAVEDTQSANKQIMDAVELTVSDCNKNIENVQNTNDSIHQMMNDNDMITEQSKEMIGIADNTNDAMMEYSGLMDKAVESMQQISETSNTSSEAIDHLNECMKEISEFANTILQITSKTNLLALNASIEAARAGDNGRGFAVVAEQVRVLAEQSKTASSNITSLIGSISTVIEEAKAAISENQDSVVAGIELIHNVKSKSEEIRQLQIETKEKAQQVYENSSTTKETSNKVANQANEMDTDVRHTLDQTNEISQAARIQLELSSVLCESFQKVDEISKSLLEISSQLE